MEAIKSVKLVIKFFKAILSPAKNDLKKIKKDLNSLQIEMREISLTKNKIEAITRLFKVISPIKEKGGFSQTIIKLQEKNYGQLDQIISALQVLQIHFETANEEGFKKTFKSDFPQDPLNHVLNEYQAEGFVRLYTEVILNQLYILKKVV